MKKENQIISAMKRGFTLVELLVVVAILGILATMAVVNIAGKTDSARITTTKASIRTLEGTIEEYKNEHKGKAPKTMDDLTPYVKGSGRDGWDNDFKLEVKGKDIIIISAGPDGDFGTDDDIRSDTMDKKKDSQN